VWHVTHANELAYVKCVVADFDSFNKLIKRLVLEHQGGALVGIWSHPSTLSRDHSSTLVSVDGVYMHSQTAKKLGNNAFLKGVRQRLANAAAHRSGNLSRHANGKTFHWYCHDVPLNT